MGTYAHLHQALDQRAEELEAEIDTAEWEFGFRFTEELTSYLMRGFEAKDKNVRSRSMNLLSRIVEHMGEIECVVAQMIQSATPLTVPLQ